MKISKRSVDGLAANGSVAVLWDAEVKGFGIRCRPSGAKHYVLKLRVGGRQRWITIGRHGSPWTPNTARQEALRLLGLRAAGRDPATERDRQRVAVSMAQLCDRFLQEHVAQHCKPRTQEEYQRSVDRHIKPALGRHRITDLTRADVERFHHCHRNRPHQANRNLAALSKMMNLAEAWGLRSEGTNPTRHVRRYPESKRERYLSLEELQRLGAALEDAKRNQSESLFVVAAISLLALTGARRSEILALRWDHVDLEGGILRLPDSKTGAKLVYLNDAALKVLRTVPKMEANPFVIVGKKRGARLINLQKPWRRIRAAADLYDVRIHDLRHNFASIGAGAGMSLPVIGRLLGHTQPTTTARYAHLAADPVRVAANQIGNAITSAMKGVERASLAAGGEHEMADSE